MQYACCGQNGAHDYILQGGGIPVTCYRNLERIQIHLFGEGCLDAVEAHAEDNVINGLIVKWLLFVVEASMMTLRKIIIYGWISQSKNRLPPDIYMYIYVCVYTTNRFSLRQLGALISATHLGITVRNKLRRESF